MKNVEVKSPLWLPKRLWQRSTSTNNVVDITNYVLMEYGQPLHAFDYDKACNRRNRNTLARDGEVMTLDGQERKLTAHNLVDYKWSKRKQLQV